MAGELQKVRQIIPTATADATYTTEALDLRGVKKVTIFGTNGADHANTFGVTVSADGTNFVTFNKLVTNVTNAITETVKRVATIAPTAATTDFASMDLEHDTYVSMKVVATQVADGTYSAYIVFQY
jgi:hypothetical protein